MNSNVNKRKNKAVILYVFVLVSTFALLFSIYGTDVYAASDYDAGTYFEIDKNPIESVEITSTVSGGVICGEVVPLSARVYPENAEETVVDRSYKIIDGSSFARIEGDSLIVGSAPLGGRIEVVATVDGMESDNSLVFTVSRTPVSCVEFTNEEDFIVIGGALKLRANAYPSDASDKNISYSIVSDTDYMQVSFSGMLSFNGKTVPDGDLSVTVRATSISDPQVFSDKIIYIHRPVIDAINATADMSEVNQQGAYSFSVRILYLSEIFGDDPVKYSINVDSSVAMIDVNGLLYVSPTAPIGSEITVSMDSYGEKHYQQTLTVVPVFATDFTPIIDTEPYATISEVDYYIPGRPIVFDVVSYSPANVTDINKVFELRVDDESMAYVDGHSVIIKDMSEITTPNPSFKVSVYSEPNGLEKTFEINVFVTLVSVTATANTEQIQENGVYPLNELLACSFNPINSTIQSVHYALEQESESVAAIRDGNLIINDDLPAGRVMVRLYAVVNGVRSNTVELDIYKPTHSLELDVSLNGEAVSDSNMPASAKNTSDRVLITTRIDDTASANLSQIVITRGAENVEGEIRLVEVTDGVACFELVLRKNLIEAERFDECIKLCAVQDGVVSEEKEIIIYIPNEDFEIPPVTLDRGANSYVFDPAIPENATSKLVEFVLMEDALSMGIVKTSPSSIYIPSTLTAGETFTVMYLTIEQDSRWQSMELKEMIFTVGEASEDTKLVYGGESLNDNGFSVVYGTECGGDQRNNYSFGEVNLSSSNPQLWVGGYVDIEIKYISNLISDYGMTVEDVKIEGPGRYELLLDNPNAIRVFMNSNARGNEFITVTVIISDGEATTYELKAGKLSAFRPLAGKLTFDRITVNGQSITGLVNKTISNFTFNSSYGIYDLNYSFSNPGEIIVNKAGNIEIRSFTASKTQVIKYSCDQYYNGKFVATYQDYSNVSIKTVSINKNGGSNGYSELIAVRNMVGLGGDIGAAAPSRNGHIFIGFDGYISREGKVIADYYNLNSLSVSWLKVESTVIFSKESGHRNKTITDKDKFTETIYPYLNRNMLKEYGFTKLLVTISYDCKEYDDGYQDLWVYSHKDKEVASFTKEHGGSNKNGSWGTHQVSFEISLDQVQTDGSFWLKWGAHGWFGDDWSLGYTEIKICASNASD